MNRIPLHRRSLKISTYDLAHSNHRKVHSSFGSPCRTLSLSHLFHFSLLSYIISIPSLCYSLHLSLSSLHFILVLLILYLKSIVEKMKLENENFQRRGDVSVTVLILFLSDQVRDSPPGNRGCELWSTFDRGKYDGQTKASKVSQSSPLLSLVPLLLYISQSILLSAIPILPLRIDYLPLFLCGSFLFCFYFYVSFFLVPTYSSIFSTDLPIHLSISPCLFIPRRSLSLLPTSSLSIIRSIDFKVIEATTRANLTLVSLFCLPSPIFPLYLYHPR